MGLRRVIILIKETKKEDNQVSLLDKLNKSPMRKIGFEDVLVSKSEAREVKELHILFKIDRALFMLFMILTLSLIVPSFMNGEYVLTTFAGYLLTIERLYQLSFSIAIATLIALKLAERKYNNILKSKLVGGSSSISVNAENMVQYEENKFMILTDTKMLGDLSLGNLDIGSIKDSESLLSITVDTTKPNKGLVLEPYIEKNTFKIRLNVTEEEYETFSKYCLNGGMFTKSKEENK